MLITGTYCLVGKGVYRQGQDYKKLGIDTGSPLASFVVGMVETAVNEKIWFSHSLGMPSTLSNFVILTCVG